MNPHSLCVATPSAREEKTQREGPTKYRLEPQQNSLQVTKLKCSNK